MGERIPLVVCTAAKGGMRSVVEGYAASGVFQRWHVRTLWTHAETTLPGRLAMAARAYGSCFWQLLRGRVSLMHVHAAMRGSFWRKAVFVFLGRMFGVPVLLHLHGSETVRFFERLPAPLQALVRLVLRLPAQVVVLSPTWHSFIQTFAPGARVTVLANYVRVPAHIRPAPDAGAAGTARPRPVQVLFMGAVGRRKGVYQLIEALAQVKAAGQVQVMLKIGGSGEVDQCRALAQQLGVERDVQFLGWVGSDQRDALLSEADIFVLPSFNEGLPMSLLEAMAAGVPVVTTRVGGIPDLVTDGHNGLLVEPGDVQALAQALVRLGQDPQARRAMAERAFAHVADHYSEAVNVPRLEQLYARALQGTE